MPSPDTGPDGAGAIAIRLDHDLCVGAGTCASMLPELFRQTDNGQSVVLQPRVDASELGAVDEVIDLCPVAAISVTRVNAN